MKSKPIRMQTAGVLALLMLSVLLSACAGPPKSLRERNVQELEKLDPVMGDWQGVFVSDDGTVASLVAQVIALGNGEYQAKFYPKFNKRIRPLVVMDGKRTGAMVAFSGKTGKGWFRDTEWQGNVAEKSFRGAFKGRENGTFALEKVVRHSPMLGMRPPAGALVLFDGTSLNGWQRAGKNPGPAGWTLKDGAMQVKPKTGSIVTQRKFKDFQLHLEFRSPFMPEERGQARGNSGVYLQGRYEVQVLDSYALEGRDNECGGIYKVGPPRVNMCAPPMQWQTYDITFHAARFDSAGNKIANARVTVLHNGVKIHDEAEIPHPTGGALDADESAPGGLMLQDHGDLVQYRNIWLVELPYKPPLAEPDEAILRRITAAPDSEKIRLVQDLAARRIYAAIDTLLVVAADSTAEVREAAVAALRNLAGPEHVPELIKLLVAAQDEKERYHLAKAIAHIEKMNPDKKARGAAVRQALRHIEDDAARMSLYYVAPVLGDLRVLHELQAGLQHHDVDVQTAAIRALAQWPNPEPMAAMLKIAKTSDNKLHQKLAFKGYVRLVGLAGHRPENEKAMLLQRGMDLARTAEQKRLVLRGLAQVQDLSALEMAGAYLTDPDLGSEAARAVVAIARGTADAAPQKTKSLLGRIVQSKEDSALVQKAKEVIYYIERFDDHLAGWEVSGPYTREGADLFAFAFPPEKGDAANASWREMPDSTNTEAPWRLELDKIIGGENRVAYLRTRVWSEREQEARLELGSDDGVKAWLNGQLVHANNAHRGVHPAEDKVTVRLQRGWNDLMLKIVQGGGGWGACARFRAPDGGHLPGLKGR